MSTRLPNSGVVGMVVALLVAGCTGTAVSDGDAGVDGGSVGGGTAATGGGTGATGGGTAATGGGTASTGGGTAATGGGTAATGGGTAATGGGTAATGGGTAATGGGTAATGGGSQGQATACMALPAATGTIIDVTPSQAGSLVGIVGDAAEGSTVRLADGTYVIPSAGLRFLKRGVTLRSRSGNASAVILEGEHTVPEILRIQADDITIAELTIRNAMDHLVHVSSSNASNISGTHLKSVHFIDSGEQFVKINGSGSGGWPDNGTIECSTFEMTDVGRPYVERAVNGCYTGGIDAHSARGWLVRWNTFRDIYCAGEGLSEHAIHFWDGTRDTVVENNEIYNCARGIGFGLGSGASNRLYSDNPAPGVANVQNYAGIIRNNSIWANNNWFDSGIGLEASYSTLVLHNSVVSTAGTSFYSSIDVRFAASQNVLLRNNLVVNITQRNDSMMTEDHNLRNTPTSYFMGFATGDLRLAAGASGAIDQGAADARSGVDLAGRTHDATPDLGAWEH